MESRPNPDVGVDKLWGRLDRYYHHRYVGTEQYFVCEAWVKHACKHVFMLVGQAYHVERLCACNGFHVVEHGMCAHALHIEFITGIMLFAICEEVVLRGLRGRRAQAARGDVDKGHIEFQIRKQAVEGVECQYILLVEIAEKCDMSHF